MKYGKEDYMLHFTQKSFIISTVEKVNKMLLQVEFYVAHTVQFQLKGSNRSPK